MPSNPEEVLKHRWICVMKSHDTCARGTPAHHARLAARERSRRTRLRVSVLRLEAEAHGDHATAGAVLGILVLLDRLAEAIILPHSLSEGQSRQCGRERWGGLDLLLRELALADRHDEVVAHKVRHRARLLSTLGLGDIGEDLLLDDVVYKVERLTECETLGCLRFPALLLFSCRPLFDRSVVIGDDGAFGAHKGGRIGHLWWRARAVSTTAG